MRIVRAARCRPGVAAVLLAAAVASSIGLAAAVWAEPTRPRVGEGVTRFTIQTRPITSFDNRDATRVRFGKLEFRGGIELRTDYKEFGGISGLQLEADNQHFLGLSDRGRWFRGRITYDGKTPKGIADAEMAPILGADGTPLARRGWYDTEALARDGNTAYVGIERVDRIVKFDYGRHGVAARGHAIATPADFKGFPYNKSLECLVAMPHGGPLGGALITVLERALDAAGNLRGFILGGKQPVPVGGTAGVELGGAPRAWILREHDAGAGALDGRDVSVTEHHARALGEHPSDDQAVAADAGG